MWKTSALMLMHWCYGHTHWLNKTALVVSQAKRKLSTQQTMGKARLQL